MWARDAGATMRGNGANVQFSFCSPKPPRIEKGRTKVALSTALAIRPFLTRRDRDSNPSRTCALTGFRNRRLQPLSHLSGLLLGQQNSIFHNGRVRVNRAGFEKKAGNRNFAGFPLELPQYPPPYALYRAPGMEPAIETTVRLPVIPASLRRAAALSVRSHVNWGSSRPK